MQSNWWEERIQNELKAKYDFETKNLNRLDEYDDTTAEGVLLCLLETCYGQNLAGIMTGRRLVSQIPKVWLGNHMIHTVKNGFELDDYWNFRRLLELAEECIPSLIPEILDLNRNSTDEDILETIEDYSI